MSTLARPMKWLLDWLSGTNGDGENALSGENALTYAPFWSCVNKITSNIGVMPLCLYRRTQNGKELAVDDPRYSMLLSKPNAYQTPIVFKQTYAAHALMWGNARAYIARSGRVVRELIPLLPDRTKTLLIEGKKYHITWPKDNERLLEFEQTGKIGSLTDAVLLEDFEVVHVPGFGLDGVEGLSLLSTARRSLNTGISGDKRYNTQVGKGFSSRGMIEVPRNLLTDEKDAKRFMEEFNRIHGGSENSDKVGMLREGMKFQALSMSNTDAEFLKQRQFQRQDTALWFMIENILGDGQTEVYKSLAERKNAYLTNCLLTWMTKIEEEFNLKLLNPREIQGQTHFFKFDASVFLRSDFASTVKAYREATDGMILTRNEARDALDYNTVEGGDEFINPNTTSMDASGDDSEDDAAIEPTTTNRDRAVVSAHVGNLLNVEKTRLLQFSAKPSNFLTQVDKFYAKWESTLAKGVECYCTDSQIASKWCKASKAALLCLAESTTYDTLKPALEEELARWDTRKEQLITEIIEC
jgi:HK97 family phage portal protein